MTSQDNPTWTSSGHKPVAFRGLFQNPDYDNPDLFRQQDAQTALPEERIAEARAIPGEGEEAIKQIDNFIRHSTPRIEKEIIQSKELPIFTRTADDILQSGYVTGCTECAVLFATLARAKGIPAIIIDAAGQNLNPVDERFQKKENFKDVGGHFLVEVYVNDKWMLVDPSAGALYRNYDPRNPCLPQNDRYGGLTFFAFAKGLSPIDIGITEKNHNRLQYVAFDKGESPYVAPEREMIDLRQGMGPDPAQKNKVTISRNHLDPTGDHVMKITAQEAATLRAEALDPHPQPQRRLTLHQAYTLSR